MDGTIDHDKKMLFVIACVCSIGNFIVKHPPALSSSPEAQSAQTWNISLEVSRHHWPGFSLPGIVLRWDPIPGAGGDGRN
jgi:hypothetical protein